jgi:hypothetical protein
MGTDQYHTERHEIEYQEKSLEFAFQALEQLDKRDSGNLVLNYILIGKIYGVLNKHDSSIHYMNKASSLAESYDNLYDIGQAKLNSAWSIARLGRRKEAINILHEVLILNDARNQLHIAAYNLLAFIHYFENNFDSSIHYGRKSHRMGQKWNLSVAKEAAELVAWLYGQRLNFDSSNFYLRSLITISDTLNARKNANEFANLRSRIETLEQQKEIDLLEKQSEIDRINRLLLTAGLIAILIIAVLILLILFYRHRARQRKSLLEKIKLQKALDAQRQELQNQTLNMINLNQGLTEMEEKIKSIKKQEVVSHRDLQTLLNGLTVNKSMDKEWSKFNDYFGKLHRNFYTKLKEQYPTLTQYDLRLCALVKVDLTNQEIAGILGITTQSVRMSKYRLKSKLNLEEERSLSDHIQSIDVYDNELELMEQEPG